MPQAISFFTVLLGVLRHYNCFPRGKEASEGQRRAWAFIHSWLGRACAAVALATVFTGALQIDAVGGLFLTSDIASAAAISGTIPTANTSTPWIASAAALFCVTIGTVFLILWAQARRVGQSMSESALLMSGSTASDWVTPLNAGGREMGEVHRTAQLTMEDVKASRGGGRIVFVIRGKVYQVTPNWLLVSVQGGKEGGRPRIFHRHACIGSLDPTLSPEIRRP